MTRRPEFSHIVHPSELPDGGARYTLEASPEERAALSARFGLQALDAFFAEIVLKWISGGAFLRLNARIRADVVQSCVVTLEPVRTALDQSLEILYAVDPEDPEAIDSDPERDVELLEGDSLDIGEIVAEEMALMLDPYPRAPGATLEALGPLLSDGEGESGADGGEEGVERRPSPFEVLATLKRKR